MKKRLILIGNTLVLMPVLLCSIKTLYFYRYLIDSWIHFPVLDNWKHFYDLVQADKKSSLPNFIWEQINEHRPVILKLIYLIDYKFFDLNLNFSQTVSLFLYFIFTLGFLRLAKWHLNFLPNWTEKTFSFCVCLFLLTSINYWEVLLGALNIGTVSAWVCIFATILSYSKYSTSQKISFLILANIAAVLAALNMAFGFVAFLLLMLMGIINKNKTIIIVLPLLIGSIFFSIYSHNLNFTTASPVIYSKLLFDIPRVVACTTCCLGGYFFDEPFYAIIAGVVGIIYALPIIVNSLCKKHINRYELLILLLLLSSILYAVMIGVGRRHTSLQAAMASRYLFTSAIFWSTLWLLLIKKAYKSKIAINSIKILVLLFSPFLLVKDIVKTNDILNWILRQKVAITSLSARINDSNETGALCVLDDVMLLKYDALFYENKICYFSLPETKKLGTKIPSIILIKSNYEKSLISITPLTEKKIIKDDKQALKIMGYAFDKNDNPPSYIIAVDDQDKVCGIALFSIKIQTKKHQKMAGFVLYAQASSTKSKLRILALNQDLTSAAELFFVTGNAKSVN